MITTPPVSLRPEPVRPALLWVFRRDGHTITCEVDVSASGRCEVRTVPQWDPSLAIVETFEHPVEALARHAEIARRLREIGWDVVDHVPIHSAAA